MKEFYERAAGARDLSFEHIHILLDALPVAVSWATLADGHIRFFSRFFKRTFGYDDDAFATVDDWIAGAYVRERDRIEARRRWQALWASDGAPISEIEAMEIDVRCADGSVKTVQHRGIILRELGVGLAVFDDISDRRKAEDALRRIAFEDVLTGLPNRRALQDEWTSAFGQAPADARLAALLLVDLDGFKAINDQFGHDVGDEALKTVARRLRDSVRERDIVSRLGGDEFAILLPELRAAAQVEQVCWRILTALEQPWAAAGRPIPLRASIGVSVYPQDGATLRDLLKHADEALYRCKAQARGQWQWFRVPDAA